MSNLIKFELVSHKPYRFIGKSVYARAGMQCGDAYFNDFLFEKAIDEQGNYKNASWRFMGELNYGDGNFGYFISCDKNRGSCKRICQSRQ